MARCRLLIVDDEPRMTQILAMLAGRWGYEHRTAANGPEALALLQDFAPEIVLSDVKMPQMEGSELLTHIKARSPETAVIMMTAYATVKSAVDAMKAGAFDYIMKPFDNEELRLAIERASEYSRLKQDNAYMRRELGSRYSVDRIVGDSPALNEVLTLIERVAPTRATVLVTGESGTGKELVAKAIHFRSQRASGPYVRVNCAALAESLLESELFGHEKGAFTGAVRTHRGKFEEADGGTIFLDEIGETSNNFQSKLLRVLQEGVVTRVGGNSQLKVDVRVVAATNRDLRAEVKAGNFREDLFFRLNVVPIHLPPLRERREDIIPLGQHFARQIAEDNNLPIRLLSPEALEVLAAQEWPGNVRELENTIERAIILSRSPTIGPEDLLLPGARGTIREEPAATPGSEAGALPSGMINLPLSDFLDAATRLRILHELERTGWRKQEAAERLGIDRATLYRQIKRFQLESS
jgi:DNA-binding NtrC family response regulator